MLLFVCDEGLLLGHCGKLNFSLALLKCLDLLANQVKDLSVGGATVILGYIVKLVVKLGINFNPEMLFFLISHKKSPKNLF